MLTTEQRIKRCYGIGGSDIAIIFGLSQYKTPYQLYLEKRRPGEEPYIGEDKSSLAADIGSYLEDKIIDLYIEKTGNVLVQRGEVETKHHTDYPYLFGNVDGILSDGGLVEAKSTEITLKKKWGDPGSSKIPREYLLQVGFYSAIYNPPYVDIPVLFGKGEFQIYRYNRYPAFEAKIVEKAIEFWENHVLKQVPPEAASITDLLSLYPEAAEEKEIKADFDTLGNIEQYKYMCNQIQLLEEKSEKYKLEILKFMRDHEVLVNEDGNPLATYKYHQARKILNINQLKKDHPDIYVGCLEEKASPRYFRLKEEKNV